jgi:hypothetical protein
MKLDLTPNPRTSNPKNSGISEAWNDPSTGVDFPRLNTDKGQNDLERSQIEKKKTYRMRMQVVSLECFRGGI